MNAFPTVGAGRPWPGWPEIRADARSAVWSVAVLALVGVPAGLLWWVLAPRAEYRVTADGPVVIGQPTEELLVADDAVFVLVLAGVGLLSGAAAWALRRRRGVAMLLALAVGNTLTGVVAWRVGEWLGVGPSEAELAEVGAVVTTSLSLASLPALTTAPFAAVAAYLLGALYVAEDGLDRVPADPAAGAAGPPVPAQRPLVDVPRSPPAGPGES